MKAYSLIFCSLCFILPSCKKKHTCDCTTVWTYRYGNGTNTNSIAFDGAKTAYSEKMSKKQARAACEHQRQAVESSFTSWYTYNGAVPLKEGESIKTKCNLILD